MIRAWAPAMIRATLLAALVAVVACSSSTEDVAETELQVVGQCSFRVTRNVYDGPSWWGTLTVKNESGNAVSGVQIAFDVPSGVACDHATAGWSYSQRGRTFVYRSSATVAAGASLSMNYSTSSQSFSRATSVKVSSESCGTPPPPPPPPGEQWRRASLTNFESYPDPNSEECIKYNGCTWAGQFAALDGKQPESWVRANNIAAVHSRDFAQYKLKTLRLRQGTKQIDVKVYDMCADSDCSGCCTANSKQTGFLIDIEKYTMQRFGSGDGVVEWMCIDCP
jgi:hypothetical protein